MKNLLFITWDGPQTSYMEGLFMPIFSEVHKQNPNWEFHVIQFTWGDEERIQATQKVAEKLGVHYQALPISRKPIASLGSFISLFQGASKVEKYIQQHKIDVVMPRSTFPAYMVSRLKDFKGKIIFDADGLPIEERIDFAGLKRNSFLYKFLQSAETTMLRKADHVITRSKKAIEIHLQTLGEQYRTKFSVVQNGRDTSLFRYDENLRENYRKKLNINDELLFVYAGSLGPQYCLPEMLEIFRKTSEFSNCKFLILTGDLVFAEKMIPYEMQNLCLLKKVGIEEVPAYLNAADVGFALRKPTYSMQGVAPIKLGEYLLCGLPVIASKGIGDSEEILTNFEESLLWDHSHLFDENYEELDKFLNNSLEVDRKFIQSKAESYFSMAVAANSYLRVLNSI